jgi:hypothetical protein
MDRTGTHLGICGVGVVAIGVGGVRGVIAVAGGVTALCGCWTAAVVGGLLANGKQADTAKIDITKRLSLGLCEFIVAP